jgi:hypothetical protein
VSSARAASSPGRALYRIGWSPNPLEWPPRARRGAGRFDDPLRRFRTLYAAEERLACFVETLARFRPELQFLVARADVTDTGEQPVGPKVPADWCDERRLGRLRLGPGQRWLDLRAFQTREVLRRQFASELLDLGFPDLDLSVALTSNRALTQAIGRWAYENGYHGIAYTSRFDVALNCWAVFDNAAIEPILPFERISRDDPDLRVTAALFGLAL